MWLLVTCALGAGCTVPLFAGTITNAAPMPSGTGTTNRSPVPPMPVLKSPVDTFRELLAMRLPERKQFLTNRPPETQKLILAKVREYESLKPDERELRLRATELRWYLLPLMSLPPTNRAARLALIPEDTRKLLEDRLAQWDLLPPEAQEEMLDNELAARFFSQPNATNTIPRQISPERRAKLEAGIDRWRGLSEEQRRKTLSQFEAFFELTPAEQVKALNTLSDAERRQMEKVLESYAHLTPEQRTQCLRSFGRFTSMNIGERLQFLKNAERWKLMTPTERETWRQLVSLAPLMPHQRTTPPLPPGVPRRTTMPLVTN
jgi:hypothetical protein